MEPQNQSDSPRLGSKVVERKVDAKKQAGQRGSSRTVQNQMSSVLGGMTTGAAQKIFIFAHFRKIVV